MSADVFDLLRRFRHDLSNDLQILSGHLQLGRPTAVLQGDLSSVVDRIQELSRIFSCRDNQLALALWSWLEQARELELSASFEVEQLAQAVAEARLVAADALLLSLLPRIAALDDEERWLHLRVDAETATLSFIVPLLPDSTGMVEAHRVEDGQMEFHLPLC